MSVLEIDYTKKSEVENFISSNYNKEKSQYYAEYNGDRKIRKLQIGHRENIRQGDRVIEAERITLNFQKKIVQTAASFLFGEHPDISISGEGSEKEKKVLEAYKANRINNKLYDFAEEVMSTTMGVFIFTKNGKDVSCRLYGHNNGTFIPKYDFYGDLEAVFWKFHADEYEYIWIFTASEIHYYEGKDGDMKYKGKDNHGFGVIPIVFMDQKKPEWFDVKELIDRIEMLVSKLSGSNNYFAFPILGLKGASFENKEGKEETLIDISEDGKSLMLGFAEKNGHVLEADAKFIQRDTGVESIDLELKTLKEMIFNISRTPDLSFNNVKGISAISGRALKLMLQDAINKAKAKQNQYQIVIERILNVISAGQGNKEKFDFNINFNLSLPDDLKEQIETLIDATGGNAILSQESGIKLSPFTQDADNEFIKIQNEEKKRSGGFLNSGEDE